MTHLQITTGVYNTANYRVVKEYKREKAALKFLKTIGYPFQELTNFNWSHQGYNYTLSIAP